MKILSPVRKIVPNGRDAKISLNLREEFELSCIFFVMGRVLQYIFGFGLGLSPHLYLSLVLDHDSQIKHHALKNLDATIKDVRFT